MRSADFDFDLPETLIAQAPASRRDASRLLVLHRDTGALEHRQFLDLANYLERGDVLVLNNSKVLAARLRGENARTGGQFEILLLEQNEINDWWAMLRPGKRARVGTRIVLRDRQGRSTEMHAAVLDSNAEGHRRLRFMGCADILGVLDQIGEVPLPPYIHREPGDARAEDRERYQTVFAKTGGSVAAPTAGLHFTNQLLSDIAGRGVQVCFVTLHVGLGTFAPVKTETIEAHTMHEERYELSEEAAAAIMRAKASGHRIVAVGTTSLRVLESVAAAHAGRLAAGPGRTRLFVYPPHDFSIVNTLLTNFHLPRSTLLMLVSAFAAPGETRGRERILAAYADAIRERYRFFSYGDAMLIV